MKKIILTLAVAAIALISLGTLAACQCSHEWEITSVIEATCDTDGSMLFTCSKCGEEKTEVIQKGHAFSSEWTITETHHYREAICEHSEEKGFYGEHDFEYNVCKDCGYADVQSMWQDMCDNLENQSFVDGNANYHLIIYSLDWDGEIYEDHAKVDGNKFYHYHTYADYETYYILGDNGYKMLSKGANQTLWKVDTFSVMPDMTQGFSSLELFAPQFRSNPYSITYNYEKGVIESFIDAGWDGVEQIVSPAEFVLVENRLTQLYVDGNLLFDIEYDNVSLTEPAGTQEEWDLMIENCLSQNYFEGNGNYCLNIYTEDYAGQDIEMQVKVDGEKYYDNAESSTEVEKYFILDGENYTFYKKEKGEECWAVSTVNQNAVSGYMTSTLYQLGILFRDFHTSPITYNEEKGVFETQMDGLPTEIVIENNRLSKLYQNGELTFEIEYDNAVINMPNTENDVHAFSNEWTRTETHHYYAATCSHSQEMKDYGEHDFENNVCKDCGYERQDPTLLAALTHLKSQAAFTQGTNFEFYAVLNEFNVRGKVVDNVVYYDFDGEQIAQRWGAVECWTIHEDQSYKCYDKYTDGEWEYREYAGIDGVHGGDGLTNSALLDDDVVEVLCGIGDMIDFLLNNEEWEYNENENTYYSSNARTILSITDEKITRIKDHYAFGSYIDIIVEFGNATITPPDYQPQA